MYEFIRGKVVEINPALAVIETGGIAYSINITVHTYSMVGTNAECILYLHHVVREDAQLLFGFSGKEERAIFRLLISVSGIGANTARLILSSLTPEETRQAILSSDVRTLQGIKGIGTKTAQRLIVDLKDKFGKMTQGEEIFLSQYNTIREESLSALVTLGFPKNSVEKILDRILSQNKETNLTVETLIKRALKEL
jgi:holliday junction DNA helicase RuvA